MTVGQAVDEIIWRIAEHPLRAILAASALGFSFGFAYALARTLFAMLR